MKTIIITDDSRVIREKLKLILKNSKFDVIGEAADGKQAVDLCDLLEPDILTLDFNMPKLDGIKVIETLRENGFEGKIIMLTGITDKKLITQALVAGANSYLIKPFDKEDVIEELSRF
jgi:two-component system chemotaxis response regulator CheY